MEKLTAFGKAVRKLRIDSEETMQEMVTAIGVSAAFMSSVETGRKPVPPDLARKVIKHFKLDPIAARELEGLAEQSVRQIRLNVAAANTGQRAVATMFARRFDELTEKELRSIRNILEPEE